MTSWEECCSVETSGKLTQMWEIDTLFTFQGRLGGEAGQMLVKCSQGQTLHGLSFGNFRLVFFYCFIFQLLLGHRKALFNFLVGYEFLHM